MSNEPIDITPLLTHSRSQSKRKMRNAIYGKNLETDAGIELQFPDGESELTWSIERIEEFMKRYLDNQRADTRWQNRRKWNYPIWRFIMDLYSEGVRHEDIANRVKDQFEVYKVEGVPCTKFTIKRIIAYRGWKVAKRMKHLLALEKADNIIAKRKHASMRAQDAELEIIEDLEQELKACVAILKDTSPIIEPKEYGLMISNVKRLREMIADMSGLDAIKHIELFQEKQHLKSEINPNVLQQQDSKQITPTIVTEE